MLARTPAADPHEISLIEIIPANVYPLPGQTRAPATIRRIVDRHGEQHARLVLCILAEVRGNAALMKPACRPSPPCSWPDPTSWKAARPIFLALFDAVPLGPYMAIANELRGKVLQGHALAGMLYLHVLALTFI